MSLVDSYIASNSRFLMNYGAPHLFTITGWAVALHHNGIRVYDPLGTLAAEITEDAEIKYQQGQPHTLPEHLDWLLCEARKVVEP